jgi:DNA polymerase
MDTVVIDFETFYSPTLSLSKLTTEEYLRHPAFEVIGVAVKVNDGETEWFSGTKADTKVWLDKFDWGNAACVAHNAMFDMAILSWHFDIKPKKIVDTLSMARAIHGSKGISLSLKNLAEYYELGAKGTEVLNALGKRRIDFTTEELGRYGKYCINDVELTYDLFVELVPQLSRSEMNLIDVTIRMFSEPVLRLDENGLDAHLSIVKLNKEGLLSKTLVDKSDLMSNPKLADLLRDCGVEPPMKISPTTGKETYAFAKSDEDFKALLEHEHPIVQALVAARLGVKSTLEETRTQRFIDISQRGLLPIPLRYYAAHTGRWGGDDKINLQNLPRGSYIKKCISAPEGYMLVDCDSAQIEARTLAWLAGQDDLVEAFENGEDVYKIMASSIYGKPVEDITKGERFVGKTTILGAGYGMGPPKFKLQLKNFGVDIPLAECQRIINVYRETYFRIPRLWAEAGRALEAMMQGSIAPIGLEGVVEVVEGNRIKLPNGLHLHYPNLRRQPMLGSNHTELVYDTKKGRATIPNRIYGGKCVENVCQALARIVIGEQMLMVARRFKVAMTVHDAVVAVVPEDNLDLSQEFVETCMRIRPKWAQGLPLNCESKVGLTYGG